MDHLEDENVEIVPIYFDTKCRAYSISTSQLYSNTPSDFDFKLHHTANLLDRKSLKNLLKSVDIAFPVMHGKFGEDGTIQRMLNRYGVPFIGSDEDSCRRCFDKYDANELIRKHGFFAYPSILLKSSNPKEHSEKIKEFFTEHNLKRAIVKPATGGSSIGVFSVSTAEEAFSKASHIFKKRLDKRAVVEPFCEGKEFTVIVLQNRFGMPVSLLPTEIETDYAGHQIFDFRKKYLPSNQVRHHCPPKFPDKITEKIQIQAEQLFALLGLRDFARLDGWLMKDGNIWFSDINPISGMEQNSFLFQQASRVGFTHRDLLKFIVKGALRREGIKFSIPKTKQKKDNRVPVNVLFGGDTAEKQVSLMSGTNVWLKLLRSKKYVAKPFLLDMNKHVWELPYPFTLNHTVEEIMENCERARIANRRLAPLAKKIKLKLGLKEDEATAPIFTPKKMTLPEFAKKSGFVFTGLHGGFGEDGRLQRSLNDFKVPYNGSGPNASRTCMDKFLTGQKLQDLENKGIFVAKKMKIKVDSPLGWKEICTNLKCKNIIVKPVSDGCSAGVIRLNNKDDLGKYLKIVRNGVRIIPANTFKNQPEIIEMPTEPMNTVLLEPFIETDKVRVRNNKLKWKKISGKVEVTIGVVERDGKMTAMSPSLTVAEGAVLSVEEKFQGGTGVNLTPPPSEFVDKKACTRARKAAEAVCEVLGIEGYCRVDAFMDTETGNITVIEVNSAPGLTASTVFYHQALAENPPLLPLEILELLISNKGY